MTRTPRRLAWTTTVLAMALATTLAAAVSAHRAEQAEAEAAFDSETQRLVRRIEVRMTTYEQVLRGAQAFVSSSDQVDRAQWAVYVEGLRINDTFPGLQGVGFAVALRPEELDAHVAAVRAEGFPEYNVTPPGERELYSAIVYLEPFSGRNLRAFGFDMYSEPVRQEAMQRAAATGQPAMSGLVTLVQEDGRDIQPGFLVYLPVRAGSIPSAPARPQGELLGWAYSPFRARDLMSGLIPEDLGVTFEVYDGLQPRPEALLFDEDGKPSHGASDERDTFRRMKFAGRDWLLYVEGSDDEGFGRFAWSVLAGGLLISVLLATITWSQVSTRERAEARADRMTADLRATQARFSALAENASDVIIHSDGNGLVTYANPATERLLGWIPRELVGRPLVDIMPERYRAAHNAGMERMRRGDDPRLVGRTVELVALRKDGSEVPVELSLSMWETHEGRQFAGILRDLTERYKAERERLEAAEAKREAEWQRLRAEELEQVDRMRARFLNMSAHELATPLTPIGLQLELLKRARPDSRLADHATAVAVIERGFQRLRTLVQDILDASRVEVGRLRIDRQPTDLGRLVREAGEALRAPARQREVTLQVDAPDALPVLADPVRLPQVLDNLLGNALKFTPAGGSVTVTARREGNEAVVRVRDTGRGLAPDQVPYLFRPFSQVHDAMVGAEPGSGLGLYISKGIVEQHGGRIWAVSAGLGQGSEFGFAIPIEGGGAAA